MQEFPKPGTPIKLLESTIRSLKGPKVTERGFFAPYTPKEKADKLFAEFLSMGVGYDLGSGFTSLLLGVDAKPLAPGEEMRRAFSGNCHAMANGLATVLKMARIPAEAREIRAETPGRAFIVHAPNFVDKQVAGHIYKDGVLWPQRYLFTNHAATWVPSLNTYYDLMAGAKYQSLDDFIEMDIRQIDQAGDLFEGQYNGETWHLQRRAEIKRSARPAGGFFRFDMYRAPVFEEPYDPAIQDSYQAYVPKSLSAPKERRYKAKSVIL